MIIKNENKKYFEKLKEETENVISQYEKKSSNISALRTVSFFVGAALIIVWASDDAALAGIIGGALMLAFILLVKHHETVSEALELAVCRKEAIEHYIMRFGDEYKNLPTDGSEYLAEGDTVAYDLDLLGKASLYQLINVCHTRDGEAGLAENIKANSLTVDLKKINAATKELSGDIDGALSFEALGIKSAKNKKNRGGKTFFDFCISETTKIPVWAYALSIILPVTELTLIVLWIMGVIGYGYAVVGFLVLLAYAELTGGLTDEIVAPMVTGSVIIRDYLGMLENIASKEYESDYLRQLKEEIVGKKGTITAYKRLNVISEAYKFSYNPVVHMLLNGLFLWNYRLAHTAIKWKNEYGESAAGGSEIISRMEYLRSLAVLGIVRDVSFAKIDTKEAEAGLSFENLYHPLIAPERVVCNSAKINSGITIITGSNMSGKTTFLRTIAINLVLAYMGAPVCAESIETGYMKLFTSMRVSDDVANGISTFYAEILRIKNMAEYRRLNKPMLCMVDEIFKGTNSADRIVGAQEAIRRLSGKNSIAMVSTHDFELCSIETPDGGKACNYHFEEYYEDNTLKFDYKLKNDRCTTTNAREILRMAGFDV